MNEPPQEPATTHDQGFYFRKHRLNHLFTLNLPTGPYDSMKRGA